MQGIRPCPPGGCGINLLPSQDSAQSLTCHACLYYPMVSFHPSCSAEDIVRICVYPPALISHPVSRLCCLLRLAVPRAIDQDGAQAAPIYRDRMERMIEDMCSTQVEVREVKEQTLCRRCIGVYCDADTHQWRWNAHALFWHSLLQYLVRRQRLHFANCRVNSSHLPH